MNHRYKRLASDGETVPVFPVGPFQFVTLLDMLDFHAEAFYLFINWLDACFYDIGIAIDKRNEDSPLTADEKITLQTRLNGLRENLEKMGLVGFKRTSERLEFIVQLTHPSKQVPSDGSWQQLTELTHSKHVSLDKIWQQIEEIRRALRLDLKDQKFLSLPSSDIKYYEQEQLFGPDVFSSFPSTRADVAEAGNCYATGRYTACVFHCMRILEKGLRALVHELNDKHAARIVFSGPVDEGNWGNIIGEIQTALENPKRQKRLNQIPDKDQMGFYSRLSLEFEYFKNAWRDDVSHARSSYDESEAKSVNNHVEAFMRLIAKK